MYGEGECFESRVGFVVLCALLRLSVGHFSTGSYAEISGMIITFEDSTDGWAGQEQGEVAANVDTMWALQST